MKKIMAFSFVLFLALGLVVSPVFAECAMCEKGKQCSVGDKNCSHGSDCDKDAGQCPIASKLMKKAKFFLANQKEIGLSEDQVAQIKAIKMATKKNMIKGQADMEIFEMDLSEMMSAPKVDLTAANTMLDQASAGWGTAAKATLADYAKLKAVLNEQQMAKAKEIWMKNDK